MKLTKLQKEKLGVLIIAGSILVIASMLILHGTLKNSKSYNPRDLCPKSTVYPHTILLFDKTDPLTGSQQAFVKKFINKTRNALRLREKFSIYVMEEENPSFPEPIFAMCNPGTGDAANELYQNPKLIQKKFDDFFGDPQAQFRLLEAICQHRL